MSFSLDIGTAAGVAFILAALWFVASATVGIALPRPEAKIPSLWQRAIFLAIGVGVAFLGYHILPGPKLWDGVRRQQMWDVYYEHCTYLLKGRKHQEEQYNLHTRYVSLAESNITFDISDTRNDSQKAHVTATYSPRPTAFRINGIQCEVYVREIGKSVVSHKDFAVLRFKAIGGGDEQALRVAGPCKEEAQ